MAKVVDRQRKAARVKGDQGACTRRASAACAASRSSTRRMCFRRSRWQTASSPRDVHDDGRQSPTPDSQSPEPKAQSPKSRELQHCYVCKQKYSVIHHFYDQLCPPCAELNFAKRTELADLRGRVALLTGGRVKIGYQAGLKLLRCGRAAHRHHALSARLGGALRAGAGLRRVGRSPRDLRPRPAPHAERRGVLPRAARHARRGSTSSSTTPARPCGVRRSSTRT